jgi:hypothetical protein
VPARDNPAVFARIESDLRNMYVLGFTPHGDARDDKFHMPGLSFACASRWRSYSCAWLIERLHTRLSIQLLTPAYRKVLLAVR